MIVDLTNSLYSASQGSDIAEEVVKDDASNPSNVLFWDLLKLNLPSIKFYDPNLPRV